MDLPAKLLFVQIGLTNIRLPGGNVPNKRKMGYLRLDGANPMSLADSSDEPAEAWTPEQEAAASVISKAIKSYIKTTAALASGKYENLRDKIPEYMVSPGNLITFICKDGIVIRYEKKVNDEPRQIVTCTSKGIAEAAALLSQNLVHIESQEAPNPPNEDFGVEFKLSTVSPLQETSHDLVAARIWFQTKNTSPQQVTPTGAKPYCLLSVRNQLDFAIQGEIIEGNNTAPNQPFIVSSTIRLMAGWDCIEVFPVLNLDEWSADFAPLWAEHDVLGAVLVAQTKEAQLNNLDPRASTRRLYASLLAEFKALLDSSPKREEVLQVFLKAHPMLLCPTQVRMWPKLQLGATFTDFVFRDANQEYLLVELERSTLQLFRQDGYATADLTHAHGQIVEWKRYLEDNLQTVQRELGLAGITPNPNGLLVIGRTQSLLPRDRRKIQTMTNESPKLRIMTYDDLYDNAKAVFENLLGPIWDLGSSTQIYYPPVN